jgi:hypothetical protein
MARRPERNAAAVPCAANPVIAVAKQKRRISFSERFIRFGPFAYPGDLILFRAAPPGLQKQKSLGEFSLSGWPP